MELRRGCYHSVTWEPPSRECVSCSPRFVLNQMGKIMGCMFSLEHFAYTCGYMLKQYFCVLFEHPDQLSRRASRSCHFVIFPFLFLSVILRRGCAKLGLLQLAI